MSGCSLDESVQLAELLSSFTIRNKATAETFSSASTIFLFLGQFAESLTSVEI